MKIKQNRIIGSVLFALAVPALLMVSEKQGWCAFGFTFPMKHRAELRERTLKKVRDYFHALPAPEQRILTHAFDLVKNGPVNPQRLLFGATDDNILHGPVYFIVPGLGYEVEEMAQPFEQLRATGNTVYFHKWNELRFTSELVDQLMSNLRWIARNHRRQEVIVLGYSAGGLLGLLAWDRYGDKLPPNLHLVTIASPFAGWGLAKGIAGAFVAPFVGEFTADIAIGIHRKLSHRTLSQCNHWVTTSCELDVNACINSSGWFPEYVAHAMPCGDANVSFLNHEMHQEALEVVLARLIAERAPPH